jgi:hypothetical protein
VQAEANAVEQSVKHVALTADQQMQQINEAVQKLSSPAQALESGPAPTPHTDAYAPLPAHKSQ